MFSITCAIFGCGGNPAHAGVPPPFAQILKSNAPDLILPLRVPCQNSPPHVHPKALNVDIR